jgi:hypothetical protein
VLCIISGPQQRHRLPLRIQHRWTNRAFIPAADRGVRLPQGNGSRGHGKCGNAAMEDESVPEFVKTEASLRIESGVMWLQWL